MSEIIGTGAAASDARLRTGDKILVCNGHSLAAVTHAQAVGSFMTSPSLVKLTIARLPEQSLLGMTMSPRAAAPRGSPRAALSLSLHGSPVGSPVGSSLAAWK